MKFLYAILFFALLGVAISKKFTEDLLLPTDKECIKELGLKTSTIVDAIGDDYSTVEGDADINAFTACAFKKVNAIDEKNDINFENLRPILIEFYTALKEDTTEKEKTTDDAIVSCRDLQGTDIGDQMVKFLNCFVKFIHNV